MPFINRIDNVIMFNKLNEEDIKVIVNTPFQVTEIIGTI